MPTQSIQALEAGAAVFCQKPLGRNASEVARGGGGRSRSRPPARGRSLLPFHRGHWPHCRSGPQRHARARPCDRSRVPQRLWAGQAVVLRSRAFGRRLRDGSGRPPRRSRAVGDGFPGAGGASPPLSSAMASPCQATCGQSRISPSPAFARRRPRSSALPAHGGSTRGGRPKSRRRLLRHGRRGRAPQCPTAPSTILPPRNIAASPRDAGYAAR